MKIIGLTQRVQIVEDYDERRDSLDQNWHEFVYSLGFIPQPLPNVNSSRALELITTTRIHGIIFTGGNDIQSVSNNINNVAPERDEFESTLISYALEKRLPIIGVCRGMQIINEYFGGSLEKLSGHVATKHNLNTFNRNYYIPDKVNSYHEWGISSSSLAKNFEILAEDCDGYIEAFKHRHADIFGIMWHPERDLPLNDKEIDFFKDIFI